MRLSKMLGYLPVISFHKTLKRLQRLDSWEKDRQGEYLALENELEQLGFDIKGLYSNPLKGIGSTLHILEEYGATAHRGTCFSDCRVSLPIWSWQNPLPDDYDVWIVSPWLGRQQEASEVKEISVWGRTIQETTAKMLINCRKAGVI